MKQRLGSCVTYDLMDAVCRKLVLLLAAGMILALPVSLAWAQETEETDPGQQAATEIAKLKQLLEAGDLDGAVAAATRATQLVPDMGAAWRALAYCHQVRGNENEDDKEVAIECYARSLSLEESEEARQQLRILVQTGRYPEWVTEGALKYLPGDYDRRTVTFRDPRLPTESKQDLVIAVGTKHLYPEQVPKRHSVYGSKFAGVVYGFVSDPKDDLRRLRLAVRVYYPTDSLSVVHKDYTGEASNTALVLGRLRAYYAAYMGKSATDRLARPLSAYLIEGAPTAPEGLRPDVAVWRIEEARQPKDWVLDICKGFGHAGFSAVGQFADPEPWAGGLIGRLIYAKWLCVNAIDERPQWGADEVDLADAVETEGVPAIQAFLAATPNDENMSDGSAQALQRALGAALYGELSLGPAELARALAPNERVDAQGLVWKVGQAFRDRKPASVRVPGGLWIEEGSDTVDPFHLLTADGTPCVMLPGRPVRYKVFLAQGTWTLRAVAEAPPDSERPTVFTVTLEGGPRRPQLSGVLMLRQGRKLATGTLGEVPNGWYVVTLTHDNAQGTVALQSLTFSQPSSSVP